MNRRLYFLMPDIQSAQVVHNELLLARIPETQMHVITRADINNHDLPPSNLLQRTDIIHATQMGGAVGGILGAIFSSFMVLMGWAATGLEGLTVLSTSLAGIFIGAVSASMIGINIPNTHHKAFMGEIEKGQVLYIVDIPVQRVEEIEQLVSSHHPEAKMKGIDPTIPAFP